MRQHLIEALDYPQRVVLDMTERRHCPYGSRYDSTHGRCLGCDIGSECHWVSWLRDSRDLKNAPIHTLVASLRYGTKLVRSRGYVSPHDETSCACEACTWIRAADALVAEFE